MKNLIHTIVGIFVFCCILLSCRKHHETPVTPFRYDSSAIAFITAANLTDSTQKMAINNLVVQLKDSVLWSKILAIYPMIGGSATTMQFNLKDPRNTDDAYRLSFYGNPAFSDTGVTFPTSNDYADTHLADTVLSFDNASMGYFSNTQNDVSGYDMGCTDGSVPFNELSIKFVDGEDSEWFGFSQEEDDFDMSNTTGLVMFSSSPTDVKRYRNGKVVFAKGIPPVNEYTNLSIWIGRSRVNANAGKRNCALAFIGDGLTDVQAFTLYNIVRKYETALGR